jgi:Zn-dependent protease with chaperone function
VSTAPALFRVTLAIGAVALALAATALTVALRSIHVAPDAPVHQIEALGIVYPAANAAAILVLGLAALGLAILTRALASIARQLTAQRALHKALHTAEDHGEVRIFAGSGPPALCAGLFHPRIYISQAALASLGPQELEAVLAHEAHHRERRDPLRLAVAQVLGDAMPLVRRLAHHHALATEIDADRAAPDTKALARALLQTSPDVDAARVDSLLGKPPRAYLPLLYGLAITAGLLLALLVLLLAGRTASGHATLALPGLSRQPCVVALALVPGSIATLAALVLKTWRAHPHR